MMVWDSNLQGGVVFSNIVTTVSPTYAQEVRTAEVYFFLTCFSGPNLSFTLSKYCIFVTQSPKILRQAQVGMSVRWTEVKRSLGLIMKKCFRNENSDIVEDQKQLFMYEKI